MQSIGERLEEARKRKGISLREAAEATKIRGDFLGYIEQNKFDFDLPEIYKRGFLKNYARYLKLDVDKILTDFNAQLLSNSRAGKKGGAELFGQMELKKKPGEATEESAEDSNYGHISAKPAAREENQFDDDEADKTFYLKIGLIFVGTLALVFVVFGLIWAMIGSSDTESIDGELDIASETEITAPLDLGSDAAVTDNKLTLIATGNVFVWVRQKSDRSDLLRQTLAEGESVTIEKDGAVEISFTYGENLLIDYAGERFKPSVEGTAKISLD